MIVRITEEQKKFILREDDDLSTEESIIKLKRLILTMDESNQELAFMQTPHYGVDLKAWYDNIIATALNSYLETALFTNTDWLVEELEDYERENGIMERIYEYKFTTDEFSDNSKESATEQIIFFMSNVGLNSLWKILNTMGAANMGADLWSYQRGDEEVAMGFDESDINIENTLNSMDRTWLSLDIENSKINIDYF